jgi:Flp pilus assembly protein TadD
MRLTVRTAAALLVLATLAAYANSFTGTWIFDDLASVVNNPTIRDWRTVFFPPGGGLTVSGRPLLNASFAVSYAMSGSAPWGHHLVNCLIHALAGLALYGLVHRTLLLPSLAPRYRSEALPLALFVALVWVLHPLQTESVTYLVQRAESLMGLWFLLTLYASVRSMTSPRPLAWSAAAVGACLLGVASKEVIVAAPLLVLLHDRAFAAGTFRAAWQRRRLLYLGLFATWIPLVALVLTTGGNRGGTTGFDVGVTWVGYWLTQFEAITRYLALSFWPHPLVFEYGLSQPPGALRMLSFALVVVPLVVATLWALVRRPSLGFLGAWFFAILAPTSLTPSTVQSIVEHRMYLPLAAVLTLSTLATYGWLGRRALWLGIATALAFASLTERRNRDYQSEITLWTDTVNKRPSNASAHNGLAVAQLTLGETAAALPHFAAATQLAPTHADYFANYAGALARAGELDRAIAVYREALRLNPDYAEAHSCLGLVLSETGALPDALTHAETAARLAPQLAGVHSNLGVILLRAGRTDDAITHLTTALRLDPASPDTHNTLGVALTQIGRLAEAAPHFESALRLRPDYPPARENLARLRALLAAPAPSAPPSLPSPASR